MKQLYESILGSTNSGMNKVIHDWFDNFLRYDNGVSDYKITVNGNHVHIDYITNNPDFHVINGKLVGCRNIWNHPEMIEWPTGFVLDNIYGTLRYQSGELPKELYGCYIGDYAEKKGETTSCTILFDENTSVGEVDKFMRELTTKTKLADGVALNNACKGITLPLLLNGKDFGAREVCILQYKEQNPGGVPLWQIHNLRCKKLYVGWSDKKTIELKQGFSDERSVLNYNDRLQPGDIWNNSKYNKDVIFDGLKNLAEQNDIEYLTIASNATMLQSNIYWDKKEKRFDVQTVKSEAKRLKSFKMK